MKNQLFKVLKWIRLWPEVWSLPLVVVLFYISIPVLRWIDPTSGVFDFGIFQVIIVLGALITAASALIFLGIQFNFPVIWDWYKKGVIAKDWLNLTPWQRFLLFLSLYFGLLLFAAILLSSMI